MAHFILVGLGNPGAEYAHTRHNTGRMVLEVFRIAQKLPEWELDSKIKARVSSGKLGKESVTLVEPETFMNKSGEALQQIKNFRFPRPTVARHGLGKIQVKNKKKEISNLVVIHDDLDIPFGSYKISFNKSSGGHKGVESIIRALKTQAFVRVRVGISPKKKPSGDAAVEKLILGKFTPDQSAALAKLSKRISEGLVCLVMVGREKAMSQQGSF